MSDTYRKLVQIYEASGDLSAAAMLRQQVGHAFSGRCLPCVYHDRVDWLQVRHSTRFVIPPDLPMTARLPFRRLAPLTLLALTALLAACGAFDTDVDRDSRLAGQLPPLSDGAIPSDFSAFVQSLWPAAAQRGISRATFDAAFAGVGPDADVLTKATAQPEFSRPIWDYLDDMTADSRIATGRAMEVRNAGLLGDIERRYGVSRHVVVAIWGMESSYGTILNDPTKVKNVIRALTTLAWKGGARSGYARQQLMTALRILQHGDIDRRHMVGSWAGAMGQTQFIPTTYVGFAVDYDGDGHRNIWTSVPDALASTANYLRKSGWQAGQTWGYEVSLPPGFDRSLSGATAPVAAWAARGVRRAGGGDFPRPGDQASLWLPAGSSGPAFLTLRNFDVIKRYNNANAYALAAGLLADRLAGGGALVGDWPRGYTPLDEAGRMELQQRLAALGYPISKIDGKIGAETRDAIRAFEQRNGLEDNGQASLELLNLLRRSG
jgi:membrane-bound lytic murein transglycosylase B